MSTCNKTAFGRALASVRASRGMTQAHLAADTGMSAHTWHNIETGRRVVDTKAATALTDVCALTRDERSRLASGWAQTGIDGDGVCYDVCPGSDDGHRAAAMMATFSGEISPDAYWQIMHIIDHDLGMHRGVAA
ncbi:MAG TPA: XRE family transcriptional regulator [Aurantimonas coralicida]|uniref:HTH cro/C1-type domain-containing protein n=1 Tax=marine sediment metagenome TaxID=412755 RepID=A0A0F9U598_9ZZZZ|nr:XRE family transcriptional regulator [Aurantimonas coralicida]